MKKLIVLIASVVFLLPASFNAFGAPTKEREKVKVYYFYGDYRCATCNKLEKYSQAAVKDNFAAEIKSGKVVWEAINYEKEENSFYVNDFNLYNKALIVAKYENGKLTSWKNLDKIWTLVRNEKKYKDYVKTEVEKYLKKS